MFVQILSFRCAILITWVDVPLPIYLHENKTLCLLCWCVSMCARVRACTCVLHCSHRWPCLCGWVWSLLCAGMWSLAVETAVCWTLPPHLSLPLQVFPSSSPPNPLNHHYSNVTLDNGKQQLIIKWLASSHSLLCWDFLCVVRPTIDNDLYLRSDWCTPESSCLAWVFGGMSGDKGVPFCLVLPISIFFSFTRNLILCVCVQVCLVGKNNRVYFLLVCLVGTVGKSEWLTGIAGKTFDEVQYISGYLLVEEITLGIMHSTIERSWPLTLMKGILWTEEFHAYKIGFIHSSLTMPYCFIPHYLNVGKMGSTHCGSYSWTEPIILGVL